jgi:hypothetical protein
MHRVYPFLRLVVSPPPERDRPAKVVDLASRRRRGLQELPPRPRAA